MLSPFTSYYNNTKSKKHIVDHLKKLICLATITLLFSLTDANFVFNYETNGGNQPETLASEEPARIIVIAMYVDPEHPEPGDEFTLGFRIKNNSTITAEGLNVTLTLPVQLELVSGSQKVHLGILVPSQELFVSWRTRANASGDCIIDLDFETSNIGVSQSRQLLEIYPKFTGLFLNPLFQLSAIIVLGAVIALVILFIRKRSQKGRHSRFI